MAKLPLKQPVLLMMLGYPGSGKTYFARQFAQEFELAHVSSDRVRCELFDDPRYDADETHVVLKVLDYMTEELLRTGLSAVLDSTHNKRTLRRQIREKARKQDVNVLTIWVQTDADTALERASSRDRRTSDEKYAVPISPDVFQKLQKNLQPPDHEDYVVISGKHTFDTQVRAVIRKLIQLGWIGEQPGSDEPERTNGQKRAMLGGRIDMTRRRLNLR